MSILALATAGCSTLPSTGPTAHEILRGARAQYNTIGFELVTIDAAVVDGLAKAEKGVLESPTSFATLAANQRTDGVGPGDILQISIFEVGVSLFGGGGSGSADGFDPSARVQTLPPITVDREGSITLPYVGRLVVTGQSPPEIQRMIEQGLRSQSQKPQALVTVRENITNSIEIFGNVRRSGRLPLTLVRERVLDAIANSGGGSDPSEDTIVRLSRGGRTYEERLSRIKPGTADDPQLAAGDRIELVKRPRSFLVLGASSRVSQIPFETDVVSLAEAVARAGGLNDSAADPSAIFLFRYSRGTDTAEPKPIVYRLNLLNPSSYFLAQRFEVRDKDVVYVGNAAANQPSKLISIINQLFSPFVTARVLAQ